jgi:hypothetical protein
MKNWIGITDYQIKDIFIEPELKEILRELKINPTKLSDYSEQFDELSAATRNYFACLRIWDPKNKKPFFKYKQDLAQIMDQAKELIEKIETTFNLKSKDTVDTVVAYPISGQYLSPMEMQLALYRFCSEIEETLETFPEKKKEGPKPFAINQYIKDLAKIYKKITNKRPGSGRGPFSRFVQKCLQFAGTPVHSEDSLVKRIKELKLNMKSK